MIRFRLPAVVGAVAFALATQFPVATAAPITVTDDTGATITLKAPAQRIVALAPHIVENLHVIGAGAQIVAAVDYSDHPEAAKKLPRVGGYLDPNPEIVLGLAPDLVVWVTNGTALPAVRRIAELSRASRRR